MKQNPADIYNLVIYHYRWYHPLYHKLGVIRTLLDRMDRVVTEEEDKIGEESKILDALTQCGYPDWSFNKVKEARQQKKDNPKPKKPKRDSTNKTRTTVTIPYVKGVTENVQRILRKHQVSTAVKPHNKLRNFLVHPKDKPNLDNTAGIVYEIPCKTCEKSYVGETGRLFGTRKKKNIAKRLRGRN